MTEQHEPEQSGVHEMPEPAVQANGGADEVIEQDLEERAGAGGGEGHIPEDLTGAESRQVEHDHGADEDEDEDVDESDLSAADGDLPEDGEPSRLTARESRERRPVPSLEALQREGETAADYLETLLDICDMDGDIDVDVEGDRAAVSIVDSEEGRVPRRLVGASGEVLEALQELTRLAVTSGTGDRSRLMLDVAGFRAGRRASLVALAKERIDLVRSTGRASELEPMNAFERKVVHDEVLAAGLVSESEGAEPHRYVVIHPAAD